MFCTKCGFELDEDAKFCPNCGEKVITEAVPVSNAVPANDVIPISNPVPVNNNYYSNDGREKEHQKQEEEKQNYNQWRKKELDKKNKLRIGVSLLAIILIVIGMKLPFYSRENDSFTINKTQKQVERLGKIEKYVGYAENLFGSKSDDPEKAKGVSTKIQIMKLIAYGSVVLLAINLFIPMKIIFFILGLCGIGMVIWLKIDLANLFGKASFASGAIVLIFGFLVEVGADKGDVPTYEEFKGAVTGR